MAQTVASTFWQRMDRAEQALCLRVNRGCQRRLIQASFVIVSRLGDGVFWYALMGAIALADPAHGVGAALRMAVTGTLGVALYGVLKHRFVRERPYISHPGILCGTAPLDRYSFPSGHTLHAVNFTLLAGAYEPWLLVVLVPFAALVAASRVVLGLHYPTDVAAGALVGASLAALTLSVWPT